MATTYDPPSVKAGDTWSGFGPVTFTVDGSEPSNAIASVRLQFRTRDQIGGSDYAAQLTSAGGDITIDDADAWQITIPAQVLDLDPATYWYDVEITDNAGGIYSWLEGKLSVKPDITA